MLFSGALVGWPMETLEGAEKALANSTKTDAKKGDTHVQPFLLQTFFENIYSNFFLLSVGNFLFSYGKVSAIFTADKEEKWKKLSIFGFETFLYPN